MYDMLLSHVQHACSYHSTTWLTFSFGAGNSILRSILPGRSKAGSSMSILLVAMTTYTIQDSYQSQVATVN